MQNKVSYRLCDILKCNFPHWQDPKVNIFIFIDGKYYGSLL